MYYQFKKTPERETPERKTPEMMFADGWCRDCDYSYIKCMKRGICKGYIEETEEDDDNTGKEETV